MKTYRSNIIVPAQLLSECLSAQLSDELRLYLLIKSIAFSGKIQKSSQLRKFLCEELGFRSEKTLYNHLNNLYQLHWIGDSNQNIYVRSTVRVCRSLDISDFKNVTDVFVPKDVKNFEEFLFAASLLQEIESRKSRVARLMGSANQAHTVRRRRWHTLSASGKALRKRKTTQSFQLEAGETYSENNLSLSFLSTLFGLPKTRVYRLKKRAREIGYIKYAPNFYRTAIPAVLFDKFKSDYGEYACRSFTEKGQITVRLTDKITDGDSIIDMYGPNVLY